MWSMSFVVAVATWGADATEPELPVRVRQAIERSIPYIEKQGVSWIEKKKCVSCHRVGTMLWSLSAAQQRGFEVSDRLDEWFAWALQKSTENEKGKIDSSGNKEGLVQLLMTRQIAKNQAAYAESYNTLKSLIAGQQRPDGSWKPGGQLPGQKRPLSETTDVTTMWLALMLAGRGSNQPPRGDVTKMTKRITESPLGKSTEWYALRLLFARLQEDNQTAEMIAGKLQQQQSVDGGWGWLVGEKSDALGTALSLYALQRSGIGDPQTITRARQFLVNSQQPDGSWPVPGTKTKTQKRIAETATYWGTTWAVIALTESLHP